MAKVIGNLAQQKRRVAQHILSGLRDKRMAENPVTFLARGVGYGLHKPYCGCALGMALVGKSGNPKSAHQALCNNRGVANDIGGIARMLRISRPLAQRISDMHVAQDFSAEQIAEKLLTEAKRK